MYLHLISQELLKIRYTRTSSVFIALSFLSSTSIFLMYDPNWGNMMQYMFDLHNLSLTLDYIVTPSGIASLKFGCRLR